MKVIADLCVVPMGVGVSVSKYVTACEKVLKAAGLETNCTLTAQTLKASGMLYLQQFGGAMRLSMRWVHPASQQRSSLAPELTGRRQWMIRLAVSKIS